MPGDLQKRERPQRSLAAALCGVYKALLRLHLATDPDPNWDLVHSPALESEGQSDVGYAVNRHLPVALLLK